MLLSLIVGLHSRIHNFPPERRETGQHNHGCVASWKLRCNIVMTKHLITALGIGVMIAVALQLKQKHVGQKVITVPAMLWCCSLISAIFKLAPVKAVVFQIIDDFK